MINLNLSLLLKAPFMIKVLQRDQWLEAPELLKLQNNRLRALVRHSYENVPYYHGLFKEAKLLPEDIRTVEDLTKIPILTKKTLKSLPLERICAANMDLKNCLLIRTSGTSGIPLSVYWDKEAKINAVLRAYRWQIKCGDKMRNRLVELAAGWVAPSSHPFQKFRLFRTKVIAPTDDLDSIIAQLLEFKPDTLVTLPSFVRLLGKEVKERKIEGVRFKHVFAGGEMLDDHTRRLCEDVFGIEMFECYGANEVGFLSGECEEHMGQHTEADCCILEITKDGEQLSLKEEGEITATNLCNFAMPMIRYNLEDLGLLIQEECSCGSHFPRLKITKGRKSELLKLRDGKVLPALPVYKPLIPIEGIRQFQMIQENVDKFILRVVKEEGFSQKSFDAIKSTLQKGLGKVAIMIEVIDEIPREKSGKFSQFKTRIPAESIAEGESVVR